jgi:hypothetical protein
MQLSDGKSFFWIARSYFKERDQQMAHNNQKTRLAVNVLASLHPYLSLSNSPSGGDSNIDASSAGYLTAQQQSNKFETFAANKNCRDITNLTMLT